MNCTIPGNNLKVLAKAILALNRLSDEILMECSDSEMKLSVMNSANTSYAVYKFTPLFFLLYTCEEQCACKLYAQGLCSIFKGNLEKDVDSCKIQLEKDADNILFTVKYKYDVVMTYRRHLLNGEPINVQYDAESTPNKIATSPDILSNILGNFQGKEHNLYLEVALNEIVFKNHGSQNNLKTVRSTMSLNKGEFLEYKINQSSNFVLSLKTFKSCLAFAEFFSINLELHFECGGKPLIVCANNPTFALDYVIATIDPENDNSTQASTLTINEDDLRAAEATNWDEDIEMDHRFHITHDPKLMNIFQRCFEPPKSFDLGTVLAENSDSDSEL